MNNYIVTFDRNIHKTFLTFKQPTVYKNAALYITPKTIENIKYRIYSPSQILLDDTIIIVKKDYTKIPIFFTITPNETVSFDSIKITDMRGNIKGLALIKIFKVENFKKNKYIPVLITYKGVTTKVPANFKNQLNSKSFNQSFIEWNETKVKNIDIDKLLEKGVLPEKIKLTLQKDTVDPNNYSVAKIYLFIFIWKSGSWCNSLFF